MAEHGDPRIERTRAQVLGTAHRLLIEHGLDAVTFARISRETGVSRTTLYRHWSSPSDLVAEAWRTAAPPVDAVAPAAAGSPGDLRSDLVRLFGALRDAVESPTMRTALPSLLAAAHADDALASLHAAFVADRRRPILARLRRAVSAGELPEGTDCDLLADLLAGPIFYRRLLRHAATSDAHVEALVDAALAAVAADLPASP